MSELYCVDIPSTAITAAADAVELTPADDRTIEIVAIYLFQTTDFGDAQEEILPVQVIRGHTTSGSPGSAITPRPLKRNAAAAGFAAEGVNTTVASLGTTHVLLTDGWNVRVPYVWRAIQREEEIEATQADTTLVVRLPSAPADGITIRGSVVVREN